MAAAKEEAEERLGGWIEWRLVSLRVRQAPDSPPASGGRAAPSVSVPSAERRPLVGGSTPGAPLPRPLRAVTRLGLCSAF